MVYMKKATQPVQVLPREGRCVCMRAVEDTRIRQQDGALQGTAKVRLTMGTTSGNEDPSHQTNSASSNRRLGLRLFGRRSETLTVGISRRPLPAPWSPFPVQAPFGTRLLSHVALSRLSHGCLTAVSFRTNAGYVVISRSNDGCDTIPDRKLGPHLQTISFTLVCIQIQVKTPSHILFSKIFYIPTMFAYAHCHV